MSFPHPHPRRTRRTRRAIFLTWLRKIHLWLGLWGAILGLLFGLTGILLNHRAILKLPVQMVVMKTVQLPLPEEGLADPDALALWLQGQLAFRPEQVRQIKRQPPQTVLWAGQEIRQPERWTVSLQSPERGVQAEYYPGNRFIKLDHAEATAIGRLTRLHMAIGVDAFWIILADTIAGSLILLSLTGLLLWSQLRSPRLLGLVVTLGALGSTLAYLGLG